MKQPSQQAQVAKLIKDYAKTLGLKCSARSESYSMGDSVRWSVENVDPITFRKLEDYASKYQYGHFNGMEDIYECSNSRDDIPQTKYCFGRNEFTDDYYQKAWDFLRSKYSNGDDKPANYEEAKSLQWSSTHWSYDDQISQCVRKILVGSEHAIDYLQKLSLEFWATVKAPTPTPTNKASQNVEIQGAHIEEHTHTKKNFQMFIVVMGGRVDSATFAALLEKCKAGGGWYSRQWGTTPGGFAFRDESAAIQFLNNETFAEEEKKPEALAVAAANTNQAEKLQTIADKMQSDIDAKFADRLTNTPKRIAQAASARIDGERLQRTQTALYALANMHKAGNVAPIYAQFTTKKAVFDLMNTKKELVQNGYHCYYACTGQPVQTTEAAAALWSLLTPKTEEQKQAEALKQKINGLQFSNIPGYFPTPDPLIDLMIEKAEISASDRVLEPSAGHGAICDRVKPLCAEVKAIECNYTLAEILEAKNYLIEKPQNFLEVEKNSLTSYEKIIMNPPFENLQDVDHVMHAFNFLKQGGRLVSIMSPSAFFRSDKKAVYFRQWFEDLAGEILDIPAGAFKAANTNIATKMIILNK